MKFNDLKLHHLQNIKFNLSKSIFFNKIIITPVKMLKNILKNGFFKIIPLILRGIKK